MICYILDNKTFKIKWYSRFDRFSFVDDIEFSGKSWIMVSQEPNVTDDDFVLCKDGDEVKFFGICDTFSDKDGAFTINLRPAECMFDRPIILHDEALIKTTGIEDFIVSAIEDEWISSGDITDKDYMTVTAATHTPKNTSANAEDGIYNLKTFLGNVKEYYGIYLDFNVDAQGVAISVRHDNSPAAKIDVSIGAVDGLNEHYSVDVLAKLKVRWRAGEEGTVTLKTYYLKTDRSITTDASDPDRADGITKAVYIEKDTEAEMYQDVLDEFKSNSYEHKISFDLLDKNMAYPAEDYYVGRNCSIKTEKGVKSSIVTKTERKDDSAYVYIEFGKLPVKLIDKIRR